MKNLMLIAVFAAFLSGCASATRTKPYPTIIDGVDIAVNLGLEHLHDLEKLEDAMTSAGMPWAPRAMSLNAEQIVVERGDFDRAKALVTSAIIRDALTVRVYKSPDFGKSPATSQLEVWEKGKKVREEPYKLY